MSDIKKVSGKRRAPEDLEEAKETPKKSTKTTKNSTPGTLTLGKKWYEKEESDSDLENTAKQKVKWSSLEHHGVIFFPQYKPHGVKILYQVLNIIKRLQGKEIDLTPEQEEVCNWWAQIIGSEFAEKRLVLKNFEEAFLELFDPVLGIEKLSDLDFTPIKEHLERQKEEKKNRSNEEKKRELEERQKNDALYKYCLFDNDFEKISNCMVEPPGIFRGRGEHPLAGRLKQRIMPEFVGVNIGERNPIPVCPIPGHSWQRVTSNNEATWLCQYKDDRSQKSHVKYIFLAAESRIKGENDKKKYQKARKLKNHIESIRKDYHEKMASEDPIFRQLGVCTYLIDILALRVGNEKGEEEADTVGCCSLRVEHISMGENSSITFDFLGKDSMRYFNTVQVEGVVYDNLKTFVQGKSPKDDLFDRINASRLNDYLKEMMENLSAKVFRTYNASITLQNELYQHEIDEEMPLEEKKNFYDFCNRQVATLCNHQKAVTKSFEENLGKQFEKIKEKKAKLKKLEAELKSVKKEKGNVGTLEGKVQKMKLAVQNEELKVKNKEENKNVALGTSKINYMDPRITISWCKTNEVPIEKVFPKTLLSKFAWAMGNEPDWRF